MKCGADIIDPFSLDMLVKPNIDFSIIFKLLDDLRRKINFDGFSDFLNGIPFNPITFEEFDIDKYLPDIQYALDLTPSINFAVPNFKPSDLYDALFPSNLPTLKSFASWIKKHILEKIRGAIGGLFDAKIDIPTIGLSLPDGKLPSLSMDGVNMGVYTRFNNELFPPMIDVDAVQVRGI